MKNTLSDMQRLKKLTSPKFIWKELLKTVLQKTNKEEGRSGIQERFASREKLKLNSESFLESS